MTEIDILKKCTVDGLIVRLPDGKLDRKLYDKVAAALNLIGGKWTGGKTQGFVFKEDPTDLLEDIAGGEKRNLKKEFQFFGTSPELSDEIVFQAQIKPWHTMLEPSAGQGAIIEAVFRYGFESHHPVDYCELMKLNVNILEKKIDAGLKAQYIFDNFLKLEGSHKWDRIIANPPFNKNQDIDHVKKMYEVLADGGRIVTITSTHWKNSTNKKETEFRDWLDKIGAEKKEIPAGAFKSSGTNVATMMLIIDKQ